jgi:hypothetical protein
MVLWEISPKFQGAENYFLQDRKLLCYQTISEQKKFSFL